MQQLLVWLHEAVGYTWAVSLCIAGTVEEAAGPSRDGPGDEDERFVDAHEEVWRLCRHPATAHHELAAVALWALFYAA